VSLLPSALLSTAQYALPALAAEFYPTEARATGVAWSMGLGRLGGSMGLALFASLPQVSPASGLTVLAVMSLVAAAALAVCRTTRPRSGARIAALVVKSSTGSAATEDRPSSSSALQPQADHWAVRFRAIHSLVPPERQEAIIRHYMTKYGVTRDKAIRSAVEDWDRENHYRT
jgi:hypothetical protein